MDRVRGSHKKAIGIANDSRNVGIHNRRPKDSGRGRLDDQVVVVTDAARRAEDHGDLSGRFKRQLGVDL